MRWLCLAFMALLFFAPVLSAQARVLGQVGATYPILERDAIDEMKERASRVNWQKIFRGGMDKAEKGFGKAAMHLPMAEKTAQRELTPSYTLPFDIPDPRDLSRVLYPAGYTFNPLGYMNFPGRVVFVNAANQRQLAWLKAEYGKGGTGEVQDIIMLTGGDGNKLETTLNRPLYIAGQQDIERFDVQVVPSVYVQQGDKFIITEIAPAEGGSK